MLRKFLCLAVILSAISAVNVDRSSYASTNIEGDRAVLNGEIIAGVRRYIMNGSNKAILASATTVPTNGVAGYAKGALFVDTNVATGISGLYVNNGTTDACKFIAVGNEIVSIDSQTAIAISGTTSVYTTVPMTGVVTGLQFASTTGIGTSATNYYNFIITNLGQAGAGTASITNGALTTQAVGIGTNTPYSLTLNATGSNLVVTKGDRLKVDVGASGTPVSTLTHPSFLLSVSGN